MLVKSIISDIYSDKNTKIKINLDDDIREIIKYV